jgi:hypothetical protein
LFRLYAYAYAEPLLTAHEQVCSQIDLVDKKVALAVADDARVQRLTSVLSVGPVTALTFTALVDDIARFESADKLQSCGTPCPPRLTSGGRPSKWSKSGSTSTFEPRWPSVDWAASTEALLDDLGPTMEEALQGACQSTP